MSIYHQQSKVLYIDSNNRTSGSHTNFSISLDINRNYYDKCCLLQLSVPKSFYNFPSGKNTFTLREKNLGGTTDTTITIPPANYNVINICNVLSSIMTSSSTKGYTYSVSFPLQSSTSGSNGLLTFTCSQNNPLYQSQLIFTTSCHQQLGFERNSTNSFVTGSLTSTNIISLSLVNRIYLKSSICSTSEQSILQEVLQTFPDYSYIYFLQQNIDAYSKDFVSQGDNTFRFTITDKYGDIIDTNGLNVMFSILLYKKNDTDEFHKQDLQIKQEERLLEISNKLETMNTPLLENKKQELPTISNQSDFETLLPSSGLRYSSTFKKNEISNVEDKLEENNKKK